MTPASWWVAIVAGLVAFAVIVVLCTVSVMASGQRAECERLGHVYAPVNPDGGPSVCWVQP